MPKETCFASALSQARGLVIRPILQRGTALHSPSRGANHLCLESLPGLVRARREAVWARPGPSPRSVQLGFVAIQIADSLHSNEAGSSRGLAVVDQSVLHQTQNS